MGTLLSFLGGTAFRMFFGEISHWITSKQEHSHEMQRLEFQAKQDSAQHERNMQAIAQQAALGIEVVRVQAEAAVDTMEAEAWLDVVKSTTKQTGIQWVDTWNAIIRPYVATWAVVMITLGEFAVFTMSENALAVCSAALGIYLADRNLMKRGK